MARFYTNPFMKDAPMVKAVAFGEQHYAGMSMTSEGVFDEWERTVTFSDGAERVEVVRRKSRHMKRSPEGGIYTEGKGWRCWYPDWYVNRGR